MVDLPPVSNIYTCDRLNRWCQFSLAGNVIPPKTNSLRPQSLNLKVAQAPPIDQPSPPASRQPSTSPSPEITTPEGAGVLSPVDPATPFPLAPASPSPTPSTAPTTPSQPNPSRQTIPGGTVELRAEQQTYNQQSQTITASGKVTMRFRQSVLKAEQLEIDLQGRKAVATGSVTLQRGSQILKGDRFEYDFGNDRGTITSASGEVYRPSIAQDLQLPQRRRQQGNSEFADPTLNETLQSNQPVRNIRRQATTGVTVGSDREIEFQDPIKPQGATITRLRYRAEKLEFDGQILSATNVRLTNDPFNPPELEVRADRATFRSLNPTESEITASNARLTIEQGFNLPIPRDQFTLSNREQDLNPFGIGYDGDERGGLYLERNFEIISDSRTRWSIAPQYYLQRVIAKDQLLSLNSIGVRSKLEVALGPDARLRGEGSITGLDPGSIGNNLRSKLSVEQDWNLLSGKHVVAFESVYRERVFNGSLGFQDVQSSVGVSLTSPKVEIGNTGIVLDYQAGFKLLNAATDRIGVGASDGRVTLGRLELSANLAKSFRLWEGEGPPVDDRATYNYSPVPVVPYLQLNTGIGVRSNNYSNGENQSLYGFKVSLQGQFGHFIAPAFDYTGFNIGYTQNFFGGSSPFLFDRLLDNRVITAGISQQIAGPFRVGFQTSVNLDNGRGISTDYYVEYSRRTFSILARYNPVLQIGTLGFKLNDLDWSGRADPF
jgi:lipopolysaccharide export system protein LptA